MWRTPLHEAVFACAEDCVDMLLKLKPDVNAKDGSGILPLEASILIPGECHLPQHRLSSLSFPAACESRVMSRIASKLLDAGHTLNSNTTKAASHTH